MKETVTIFDGDRVSFRKAGAGDRALVCVHGLAQSSLIWEGVIESLPPGWTGYALDLLGFGDSDKPDGGYSIDLHARTVKAFLERIPEREVVVAGNSLGGVVVMDLVVYYAPRIRGLVLSGTGPRVRDPEALRAYRRHLETLEMTREAAREIVLKSCFIQPSEALLEQLAAETQKAKRSAILETMSSSLGTDLVGELHKITVPTLVFQGLQDIGRPPEDGLEIVRGIGDGRLVVLPRAGHNVLLDAPSEFRAMLATMLALWTESDGG